MRCGRGQTVGMVDTAVQTDAPALRGEIEFDHVEFGYDGGGPVLHDLSLTIAPSETVALVGPSGAGKTTLMALVARFYEPSSGQIRIDGIPLREMTLASLRKQVGLVSQEVFLFGGTLRENIAYGRLGATEAEIVEAIANAQLTDLVAALPEGLDRAVRLVLVTPDMHRVHHSIHRAEHDSNYGFALSVWDRIFRTYRGQPAAGHSAMKVGLQWQDEKPAKLGWSLWLPFR